MDRETYLSIQRARAALKPLNARSPEEKAAAMKADRDTHAKLKALCKMGANRFCADCGAAAPGWASLPHGVFVCLHCAQTHRHLGRHISQVKAVNTGTYLWYPDEVEVMRVVGNARANALYLGRAPEGLDKPHDRSLREEVLRFARAKYERQEWMLTSPSASAVDVPQPSSRKATPSKEPNLLLSFDEVPHPATTGTSPGSPDWWQSTTPATITNHTPWSPQRMGATTMDDFARCGSKAGATSAEKGLSDVTAAGPDHLSLGKLGASPLLMTAGATNTIPLSVASSCSRRHRSSSSCATSSTTTTRSTDPTLLGASGEDFFASFGL